MNGIVVRRLEGRKLLCTAGPHQVVTDRKREDGGTDAGPTSGELLLLAIGSCAAGSLRTFLANAGHPSEGIAVQVAFEPSATDERDAVAIDVALPGLDEIADRAGLEDAARSGGVVSRIALGSELRVRFRPAPTP